MRTEGLGYVVVCDLVKRDRAGVVQVHELAAGSVDLADLDCDVEVVVVGAGDVEDCLWVAG